MGQIRDKLRDGNGSLSVLGFTVEPIRSPSRSGTGQTGSGAS